MSYCRFSSDSFQCDAYVYEDVHGGYTIHLASNKVVGDIPSVDPSDLTNDPEKYLRDHNTLMGFLNTARRESLNLPNNGETFNLPTPGSCAVALMRFRDMGYRIPQYAIDSLIMEVQNE